MALEEGDLDLALALEGLPDQLDVYGQRAQRILDLMGDAARDKDPLEQALKTRELPQVKTGQPASGLLYFAMEKQKMKDLELVYGGRENRIALRFK